MKIYMHTPLQDGAVIGGHVLSKTSYDGFLTAPRGAANLARHGLSGRSLFARLRNPEFLHSLFLSRDRGYMSYLETFREKYQDYDVIVLNPGVDLVHPEFLHKHFAHALKILHFVDDPHTTYSYGLPFCWAFDAATYISPSYSADFTMEDLLRHAGFKSVKWIPHCVTNTMSPRWSLPELEEQLHHRLGKAIYVGSYYSGKQLRLSKLKHALGSKLDLYGRYPLKGYSFGIFSTLSGFPSSYRVVSVSDDEREAMYSSYAIGINLHLSSPTVETGNARLYELAYRGVAQVVDSSPVSAVNRIFEPDREILTYETTEECVEKVLLLISNVDLRVQLALQAYRKATDCYQYQSRLNDLFHWFGTLLRGGPASMAVKVRK